ncbi:hypothetical protein H0H87_008295 [Tephrocybe sp. NHM501043]|nr:hypothetical protein H0H87_008295 [Tephrocybe sp. NHM501043]
MWDSVTPRTGEDREKELKAEYWTDMLKAGSIVQRAQLHADPPMVGAQEMAQDTIDTLLFHQTPVLLQIQTEIVNFKLTLQETQAGRHLALKYKEMLDDLSRTATLRNESTSAQTRELEEEINRLKIPTSRRFINKVVGKDVAAVGHGLKSQTTGVKAYPFHNPGYPTHRIMLVDTPGFDDIATKDSDILRRIGAWLVRSYRFDMKLAGVVYLHKINNNRWQTTGQKNRTFFERLCGKGAAKKIVLLTTMWDSVTQGDGIVREEELKHTFWSDMVHAGSAVMRASGDSTEQNMIAAQQTSQSVIDFLLSRQTLKPALRKSTQSTQSSGISSERPQSSTKQLEEKGRQRGF